MDRPPRLAGFLIEVLIGDVRQRQGAAGHHHVPEPGQQRAGIVGIWDELENGEQQDDDRVVVDVDDPDVRADLLGDLVDVRGGGQARAAVEELADAPLRGEERECSHRSWPRSAL